MALTHEIKDEGVSSLLILKGDVDENANFSTLKIETNKPLIIDLKDIGYLNSMGLRSWILWVKTLKGRQIQLKNCPPLVINQMNILDGFLPLGGIVDSFWAPYHCEHCGHEFGNLAKRGVDYHEVTADQPQMLSVPLEKPCPSCGETADIDVIPSKFFSFLGRRRSRGA